MDKLTAEIDAYRRFPVRGHYLDEDGDVTAAVLVGDSDVEIPFNVDGAGRTAGEFEVVVGCNGVIGGKIDYEVVLRDAAGNESDVGGQLDATCVAPTVCGDGEKQGDEKCDPKSTDAADACAAGSACANDCTCKPSDSCARRCCPTLDAFCSSPDLPCQCDPECRTRGDCCSDAKAECGS